MLSLWFLQEGQESLSKKMVKMDHGRKAVNLSRYQTEWIRTSK